MKSEIRNPKAEIRRDEARDYNPCKPRRQAPDARVKNIGGNLRQFQPGQTQHLALEAPLDDLFMGGIVNKYFVQTTGALYRAVWTDLEKP